MKCVLVTGGAGFLGSHLCDRLIKSGNYVICLDNFFTGSKENIQHLMGNSNFELEERDIIWPYMKGWMRFIIWLVRHHRYIINVTR